MDDVCVVLVMLLAGHGLLLRFDKRVDIVVDDVAVSLPA